MKKICIVAGARPNFVKIAPLIRAIETTEGACYELVYTGNEDDPTLEASLFEDLQMPRPSVFLGVDSTSLNEITSLVMSRFDTFLDNHPTDVVIVVDDLASTMATAIVTKKKGILLAHLVAGTRSFDINMPKEINRLVIDALSDYLFTAGIKGNSIAGKSQGEFSQSYMVGNILLDTLRFNHSRLRRPHLEIQEGEYLVLTLNRKALLADELNLKAMLKTIAETAGDMPVIAPLRSPARELVISLAPSIQIIEPLPYLEFGWLTAHAKGIITDSGNVAEEATFNNVPCITLNSYTEHPETVIKGSNELIGEDPVHLAKFLRKMLDNDWKECSLPERWDGRTAERIVKILV